ncbi:hypothetical protein IEU95_02555 [Hoyosella rhizosphaerae]|uniref:Uncharacterized protein n=1 Tax=Hoyosella rhizosphaerae TaxID=1755582 RepID=A0A916UCH2_9ACTN|nr:hypothetical protein [Hoyosella rhizosphaerae]MBN4925697.1 hypothetical protein [Hoyosella rhizosphaerae]GGC68635.1 hypothetical protein GCM10011410_21750 [Hoyosella rhizosphaerae]
MNKSPQDNLFLVHFALTGLFIATGLIFTLGLIPTFGNELAFAVVAIFIIVPAATFISLRKFNRKGVQDGVLLGVAAGITIYFREEYVDISPGRLAIVLLFAVFSAVWGLCFLMQKIVFKLAGAGSRSDSRV